MNPLTVFAPAKLNLSLRVLGRRDDGFHDIDTLMVKLPTLADQLDFTPADSFSFSCNDPSLPADESNLAVKAVRAFAAASGIEPHCHLALTKHIPHAAGLGGGSSDAATTLSALNRLHNAPLSDSRLMETAAGLGSDIPFFLGTEKAARCTGRGETITPAEAPAALPVALLKPGFGVSTADAYSRWKGGRADEQACAGLSLANDLEIPVFGKFYFLADLKQWLQNRGGVVAALLAGSGSTVFAILENPGTAPDLIAAARHELDPGLWAWSGTTA